MLSIHKRIRSIEQLKSKTVIDALFSIRRDSFVHSEEFNQRQVSVKQYLQQCKALKKQLKQWQESQSDTIMTDADDSALNKLIESHLISKSPSFVTQPKATKLGEVVDLESGSFIKKDITEKNRLAVVPSA